MKKQFFAAAMILALGAGFTACSSDDLNVKEQKEVKNGKEATTYMSYTFTVPTPGTRAAATNDGQGSATPANNYIKDFKGVDKIAKVSAYVFNGDEGSATLEATQTLTGTDDFDFVQDQTGTGKTIIKPKKAIKVTVGKKTVFLVVNPSADVETLLGSASTLTEFKTAYNSASLGFTGRSAVNATNDGLDISTTKPFKTAADVIATLDAAGSTILMTGAEVSKVVAANVTEDNTKSEEVGSTNNNRFNFTLKRAVATVSVSTKAASYDIKGDDPTLDGVQNVTIATISDLTFSEAQGEQKLYFSQQAADAADNTAYKTPAYDFVPSATVSYDGAKDKYEYNGLWRTNTTVTKNTKGVAVVANTAGVLTDATAEAYVKANLGVAFLPATHKWTESGDNYKEGNTPYVLVRGYITPKFVYKLNGDELVVEKNYTDANVYYGADGKFYATDAAAQKAAQKAQGKADAKQTVKFFKNRIVLYTVWINPDNATGKNWKNSPTSRNNIYHISINNIKTIGESWNPLVPGGFPNPDPKPGDTESPNEGPNRHDPTKPLSPVETWMSVDATIVPWAIHSYGVDL